MNRRVIMNVIGRVVFGCSLVVLMAISMNASAAPKAVMIEFWNDVEPSSGLKMNHTRWDGLLKKYVNDTHESGVNRFDYDRVTETDKKILSDYLAYLQQMDPRQLNRPRQKAFWLNLYNATIVWVILESEPKESIKSIGRLWRNNRLVIARQKMSLDDIQHGVLRPLYKDPRIHFGLSAGTVGSGDILPEAYNMDNVEELLERNTKRFFTKTNKGVSVEDGVMVVSTIMKWYKKDFGSNDLMMKAFIKKYVNPEMERLIDQTRKTSYQYDWTLNKP